MRGELAFPQENINRGTDEMSVHGVLVGLALYRDVSEMALAGTDRNRTGTWARRGKRGR